MSYFTFKFLRKNTESHLKPKWMRGLIKWRLKVAAVDNVSGLNFGVLFHFPPPIYTDIFTFLIL